MADTSFDALTSPPDPEAAPRPFVAERYGIRPKDVLDIAPLLFLIAAERSLLERRRRLDEIYAVKDEAGQRLREKTAHLGAVITIPNNAAERMEWEEEKSLRGRDIFGSLIEYEYPGIGGEGPFVHFVRGLAEGLPPDAVTSIESSPQERNAR